MVILFGNGLGDLSSILDKALYISHNSITFRKGMNPTILPPAMRKMIEHIGLLSLGMATCQGEGNLWKLADQQELTYISSV